MMCAATDNWTLFTETIVKKKQKKKKKPFFFLLRHYVMLKDNCLDFSCSQVPAFGFLNQSPE